MNQPIISMEAYERVHMNAKLAIENYLWIPRSNYQTLDEWTRRQLDHRSKMYMCANNPYSRIECVSTFVKRMTPVIEAITSRTPAYFVTLVPAEFALPYDPQTGFDVDMVTAFAKQALKHFHSIGMVEAALYTGLPGDIGTPNRTISWHTHSLVWGAKRTRLDNRLARIRAEHKCLVPGFTAAHCKRVTRERAHELLFYMSKAPMKQYRASMVKPGNGWSRGDHGNDVGIKQWKQDLRPGDRIRMCKVFKDIHLDDLLFGTGKGAKIRDAVVEQILAEFNRRHPDGRPLMPALGRCRSGLPSHR